MRKYLAWNSATFPTRDMPVTLLLSPNSIKCPPPRRLAPACEVYIVWGSLNQRPAGGAETAPPPLVRFLA